jgi:pimeloyl-ACP methyl ester carboxylesterase/DNA-binding SARP family transcriptional activator
MQDVDVRLLGTFAVEVDGTEIPSSAWPQRRAADVVKLLALARGHRLPRDRVLEALWPHLEPQAAAAALHKAAHYARRTLGARDAVVLVGGVVALAPGGTVTTDVARFEAGDDDAYTGELLPDDRYEAWADEDRERLRRLALDRLRLARRWEEVIELAPADEEAYRHLMRDAARTGDRSAVVELFGRLRADLARLGTQPSPETQRLLRELSRGPAVHAALGELLPMAGRATELSIAIGVLDRADTGEGGVLLLTGEGRSGKTRLAEAVLHAAQERRWHTVRASGGERARPLDTVRAALLHERPDLGAGDEGEAIVRAARERGCVVLLDDLHAAADEAAAALLSLAETAALHRLLIVASWRPSEARACLQASARDLAQRRLAVHLELDPVDAMPRTATRYATTADGARIAYQVVGAGEPDVVLVPGFVSNVEHYWEMPVARRMFSRIAERSRLILWDKRGTGLSDPVADVPTLEERMLDLTAVLDAAGSERPVLYGVSEGGPMAMMFAARFPERVRALVLYGTGPRFRQCDELPNGWDPSTSAPLVEELYEHWGTGALLEIFAPSHARSPASREVFGRFQRAGASPSMGRAMVEAMLAMDVRHLLGDIAAPTLVVHRADDRMIRVEGGRLVAERVPGAVFVELPGEDHFPFLTDMDDVVDELEAFVSALELDRGGLGARA